MGRKKIKKPKVKIKQGRPQITPVVPKDILKYWKKNYDAGDFTKISAEQRIGRPTIRRAWDGRASLENMDKITAFYKDRERQQEAIKEKIKLHSLGGSVSE